MSGIPGSIDTPVPAAGAQVSSNRVGSTQTAQTSPAETTEVASPKAIPEVKVSTSLREPITEVARDAESDKVDSLKSLKGVAENIKEAIETLNSTLQKAPTKAIITRDEELNRFIVRIADKNSGEIIREIPPEALLKFARNLQEIKGLLFDETL